MSRHRIRSIHLDCVLHREHLSPNDVSIVSDQTIASCSGICRDLSHSKTSSKDAIGTKTDSRSQHTSLFGALTEKELVDIPQRAVEFRFKKDGVCCSFPPFWSRIPILRRLAFLSAYCLITKQILGVPNPDVGLPQRRTHSEWKHDFGCPGKIGGNLNPHRKRDSSSLWNGREHG